MDSQLITDYFTYQAVDADGMHHITVLQDTYRRVAGHCTGAMKSPSAFEALSGAIGEFAAVINEHVADCADKTTAIRCLRLARMAGNHAILIYTASSDTSQGPVEETGNGIAPFPFDGYRVCLEQLGLALMWARAAIAMKGR